MGKRSRKTEKHTSHTSVFIGMALDMSWRLALVVLIPIIAGFKLDETFNTSPLLIIVGFLMAMGGVALVMWRTVQAADEVTIPKAKQEKHT